MSEKSSPSPPRDPREERARGEEAHFLTHTSDSLQLSDTLLVVSMQSKKLFALTPALSPRRGAPFARAGMIHRPVRLRETCESFSLSLGERAGVRASLYSH